MPNQPYLAPSVTITELESPSFIPILDRPTTIAIVGEAQNFLSSSETLPLVDSTAVQFKQTGVDVSTLVVKDALNPLVTYGSTDYVISTNAATGISTIARNIYSHIPTNADLVAVATTAGGSGNAIVSIEVSLSGGDPTGTLSPGNGGTVNSVALQARGKFSSSRDYTQSVSSSAATIARRSSGSLIVDGQTVYVNYITGTASYSGEAITLNGTTPVHLAHEVESVDSSSIVIFNANPNIDQDLNANVISVATYSQGSTNDYVTSTLPGSTFTLTRSINGPTTIGLANNRAQVRVSYQATPVDYWRPTRVFSISDVESRYGQALDSSGSINSPLSFGALMAFVNGASDLYVLPVSHSVDGTTSGPRTRPTVDNRTTYLNDWSGTVQLLRDLEDVNVIVPIISHTKITTLSDGDVLSIFQTIQSHINLQDMNDQMVIGIYGEDSTNGVRAQSDVLRAHAQALGSGLLPERQVLASPGSFGFSSNSGGGAINIGGQYVAAALAGMIAARAVQTALTKKPVSRVLAVNDFRSKIDMDMDAQAGLLVVMKKNGVVQVRHSITTAVGDPNTQELSVVRAKHFMIESIRTTLDTQIIGQIIVDATAAFTVASTVQGLLENLMAISAIAGYAGIAARSLAPAQPTVIEVRFSYLPSYTLNYIQVIFSIDQQSGDTTVQTSS